ncbi:Macrophage erythroblast attacher isoform 1 [Mycena sanguinolenta]|uniref:Macrophage erythroblast attacher isoform 1 n=1 Tax=Mycena sanguinolenta TaxID=230812 RepID=A0A8H6XLE7_9AGAR|nr:Macrophage erythroblast attacher isoform 1 [Mycena sanguinolenta]
MFDWLEFAQQRRQCKPIWIQSGRYKVSVPHRFPRSYRSAFYFRQTLFRSLRQLSLTAFSPFCSLNHQSLGTRQSLFIHAAMSYNVGPPSPTSSASSFSSGPPQTPTSPDPRRSLSDYQTSLVIPSLPDYSDAFSQKPKQSTAERRASHNAVERARRETLNARFLDLAGLLPNLKHLRRPSKSAIVNSSIAHVRAARRYRNLASQQLRALNAECAMIRREVNQWRARAGVPPAVIPPRSEAFALVLGGEEPAFDPIDLDGEDEDDVDFRRMLPHRRPQPTEAVCEGPLLLSDPYARTSPPPDLRCLGARTPDAHVHVFHAHASIPLPSALRLSGRSLVGGSQSVRRISAAAAAGRRVGVRAGGNPRGERIALVLSFTTFSIPLTSSTSLPVHYPPTYHAVYIYTLYTRPPPPPD